MISKLIKYATAIRKLPAVIARYLPSKESLIHPATGSSTNTGVYTGYVFLKLKISEIKLAAILKRTKLIRALHTRRSVVPRENGLQLFVSVNIIISIFAHTSYSCGSAYGQNDKQKHYQLLLFSLFFHNRRVHTVATPPLLTWSHSLISPFTNACTHCDSPRTTHPLTHGELPHPALLQWYEWNDKHSH